MTVSVVVSSLLHDESLTCMITTTACLSCGLHKMCVNVITIANFVYDDDDDVIFVNASAVKV